MAWKFFVFAQYILIGYLGFVRLGKSEWLPRMVRAPWMQGLEIGEKLVSKYDETSHATKPIRSNIPILQLI